MEKIVAALLVVMVLLGIFVFVAQNLVIAYWSGHTDLDVHFHVTDEATGLPIESVAIDIDQDCEHDEEVPNAEVIRLWTDANGEASTIIHDVMCGGTDYPLNLNNTFSVDPFWGAIRLTADGYEVRTGETASSLADDRVGIQTERMGSGRTLLKVPITLRRMPNP